MVNPKVSDGVFKNALRKAEQELGTDLYEQGSNTLRKKSIENNGQQTFYQRLSEI